jgi:hypothetical protein
MRRNLWTWCAALAAVAAALATARPAGAAATSWCGTVAPDDRPQAVAGYPVHVVYAFAGDVEDRSGAVAPEIAAAVDEIDAWWLREDPNRSPRFDLYDDPCGRQLDLSVLRVPGVDAGTGDAARIFDLVTAELRGWPGWSRTKYLVFFDGGSTGACGIGGTAEPRISMGLAVVFLSSCVDVSKPYIAAHELVHALGSTDALAAAPHACPDDRTHVCDSTEDVLYVYSQPGLPLSAFHLDVGRDDYYGASAPVSLQSSPWLRLVDDQMRLDVGVAGDGRVTSDVPGLDCTTACGADWDRGSALVLRATPGPESRFVGWGGACAGSGVCRVRLDRARAVTALFAPATFRLDVAAVGGGVVTSAPAGVRCAHGRCGASFASYVPVRLTAKPSPGWRLAGWGGACRGAKRTCVVPMTSAASVRASFARMH